MAQDGPADSSNGTTVRRPDPELDEGAVSQPYSRDDFRLRLERPLFKTDDRMARDDGSLLREIVWDHVVGTGGDDRDAEHRAIAPLPPVPVAPPPPLGGGVPAPAPRFEPRVELSPVEPPGAIDAPAPVDPRPAQAGPETAVPQPPRVAPPESPAVPVPPVVSVVPVVSAEAAPVTPPTRPTAPMSDPVTAVLTARAPSGDDAVNAELNRLAFLPDLADADDAQLPAIAFADPEITPPRPVVVEQRHVLPRLSDASIFAAKPSAGPMKRNVLEEMKITVPPPPRRKRHTFRKVIGSLLVLGALGGGLLAVKRFVLDAPAWQSDVKPLADEVATERGLTFVRPVPVEELPFDLYAESLTTKVLGTAPAALGEQEGEWRAAGLLTGTLDARAIGAAAVPDLPAFYDPGTGKVYVVKALSLPMHRFALARALTQALLDQHFHWGTKVAGASPSQALAVRAVVDGDALAVAAELVPTELERTNIEQTRAAMRPESSPSPYASAVIGQPGLALRSYVAGLDDDRRAAMEESPASNDGAVFDAARPLSTALSSNVGDPSTVRGMMYWYYALAPIVGPDQGWLAALAWAGDDTVVKVDANTTCVSSTIYSVDAAGAQLLTTAFTQWVAAGAPGTGRQALLSDDMRLTVTGCDSGNAATLDFTRVVDLGGSVVEHQVVVDARARITTPFVDATQHCVVVAARSKGATLSAADDVAPIVEPTGGWTSPAVQASLLGDDEVGFCASAR